MSTWLTDVCALAERGEPCVLITVVATKGSVPREAGTRMVVTENSNSGTIGGGHLEYRAIDIARGQLLDTGLPETFAERFPLGASLGQCCGGLVYLSFERLTANSPDWLSFVREHDAQKRPVVMVSQLLPDEQNPREISSINRLVVSELDSCGELAGVQQSVIEHARARLDSGHDKSVETIIGGKLPVSDLPDEPAVAIDRPALSTMPLLFELLRPDAFTIHIFGAGHVGRAIVNVLSGLPCKIHWIDSRIEQFPDNVPANVQILVSDQPEAEVDDVPAGSYLLIMTHSHSLDEAICERALQRNDLAYCGLIGSASKRGKFIRRFKARGMSARSIDRLTCPIGMAGLPGKHPGEIAIAVSAELLHIRQFGNVARAGSSFNSMTGVNRAFANTPALESA